MNFVKFVRTPFLQNTTGRLILIRTVSIVVKGELANETVNYNTKTKAYVPIWTRSVSYQKRVVLVKLELVSEAVVRRFSSIRCPSTQVFSCEMYKIFKNTFFTEQLQWLLLTFNSHFQRSPEQKPARLSVINTRFSWKKVFAVERDNSCIFFYLFIWVY